MSPTLFLKYTFMAVFITLSMAVWTPVVTAGDMESFQHRIDSLEILLKALDRIETDQRITQHASVAGVIRQRMQKARKAHKEGDVKAGWAELNGAYAQMQQAIITLRTEKVKTQSGVVKEERLVPGREGFDHKLASLKALLKARSRIANAQAGMKNSTFSQAWVEKQIQTALGLVEGGKTTEGRRLLEEAYQTVKSELMTLKKGGGDTYESYLFGKENPTKARNDFNKRLNSVKALKTAYGTIARKKKRGVEADSLEKRLEKWIALAEQMAAKDKLTTARELLDQSYEEIKTALKGLREGDNPHYEPMRWGAKNKTKESVDFHKRLAQVNALQDAFQRISKEKKIEDEKKRLWQQVGDDVDQAKQLADQGMNEEGLDILHHAYGTLKRAVADLRQGETLVQALIFETPADEYHYELDRFDTHRMLLRLLLENKSKAVQKRAESFLPKATTLYWEAAALADIQAFVQAIKSMEEATQELIKGLRNAGVVLPGG